MINVISSGIVVGFGITLMSWLIGMSIGLVRSLINKITEV